MTFDIIWSKKAFRQLRKLDRPIAKQIFQAVSKLAGEPQRYLRRIVKSNFYRMRVGDYRVIVDIDGNMMHILVVKIGHRKKIYK